MKVLIIGHVDYSVDNAAALRVLEVANTLLSMGHEVEIFKGMPTNQEYATAAFNDEIILHQAPLPHCMLRRALIKLGVGFSLLHDQKIKKPWDVVYCYGSELSWLLAGWLIARRSKARLIADITEMYGIENIASSFSQFRTRIGTWIGIFLIVPIFVRNLAVPSEYFRRIMSPLHHNITVLPPFFRALPKAGNRQERLNSELILAYAGSPANKEQFSLLFHSLMSLPVELTRPIRFRLVGIDEAQIDDALRQCGALALRQHPCIIIEALGRTDVATARQTVAQADFIVVLRNQTLRMNCGFPSKVAEAYRIGTAVISNSFSDMEMYLEHGRNGFMVEAQSAEELTRLLLHCIDLTPQEIERIGSQAFATGELYFSQEAVVSRLEHLLT